MPKTVQTCYTSLQRPDEAYQLAPNQTESGERVVLKSRNESIASLTQ